MNTCLPNKGKKASPPEKHLVKRPKLKGVLGFYRAVENGPWLNVSPQNIIGVTAPMRCPSPLFQNTDAFIRYIQDTTWLTAVETMSFAVEE